MLNKIKCLLLYKFGIEFEGETGRDLRDYLNKNISKIYEEQYRDLDSFIDYGSKNGMGDEYKLFFDIPKENYQELINNEYRSESEISYVSESFDETESLEEALKWNENTLCGTIFLYGDMGIKMKEDLIDILERLSDKSVLTLPSIDSVIENKKVDINEEYIMDLSDDKNLLSGLSRIAYYLFNHSLNVSANIKFIF